MKNKVGKELYTFKFYKRNKLIYETTAIDYYFAKREYEEKVGVNNVLWTRVEAWTTNSTSRLLGVERI